VAGALIGDMFSTESHASDTHGVGAPLGGEFIMAIDPKHCNQGSNHLSRAEALFSSVLDQPGTRLPSERRYKAREKHLRDGVDVSQQQLDELSSLAVS